MVRLSEPPSSSSDPTSRQLRMREKAEEINLVLLQPDVDLWKLRELALTDGGLVNDTLRRRAWVKLVGLTRDFDDDDDSHNNNYNNYNKSAVHERKVISVASPDRNMAKAQANKQLRKGTVPYRVTNFGEDNQNPATAFTGGPFDQHDTAAVAALAEDDNTSLASFDSSNSQQQQQQQRYYNTIVTCLDAEQIERDVTRCTWHLLTGGQRSRRRIMLNKHRKKISRILRRKQQRLGDLINLTLAMSEVEFSDKDDRLCYFQGYHDVASIFLATLGGASTKALQEQTTQQSNHQSDASASTSAAAHAASMGLELSSKVLYQVSLSHFREPMRPNFLQLQTALRMVLFPLLRIMDPEVHAHLYACGMEPFFALSWMLTWFSHDIRDTALVKRLFDFFLVSHPLMPIYLSVAMICHPSNRQEILATPCEFAELHHALSGLPKNSSMVGWKYRVGDGYVSDDEEVGDGETTSISLDSDMASHLSSEKGSTNRGSGPSLLSGSGEGMLRREDLILSEGHAHVVSMGIPAHVPFQDLMDKAISYMRRVPPRKLLDLATRYFDPRQAEPMLKMYPTISLFQPPPSWALAKSAKADWVLKQRARERNGLTARSRRDRRALCELRHRANVKADDDTTPHKIDASKPPSSKEPETKTNNKIFLSDDENIDENEQETLEVMEQSAKDLNWPKAYVALGFGPGIDEAARQRKRRKLLFLGGAATVAIMAMAIGFTMHHRTRLRIQQQEAWAAARESRRSSAAGGGGKKGTNSAREEAVTYVKSAGKPTEPTKRRDAAADIPGPSTYDSADIPTAVPAPAECKTNGSPAPIKESSVENRSTLPSNSAPTAMKEKEANESLIKTVAVKQIELMLKKVQLIVRTLQILNSKLIDSALVENLKKNLSKLFGKVTRLATNPKVRDVTAHVTRNVARFTIKVLNFTAHQARAHLGGSDLEELPLL